MTKQKSLTEKQKQAIIFEDSYEAFIKRLRNIGFSDTSSEFDELLANQEQLSGELGEMWEKYLYGFSKKDDLEAFIVKLEGAILQSDLSPETKDQYLKMLGSEKKLLEVSKQEENVPGKDGPT